MFECENLGAQTYAYCHRIRLLLHGLRAFTVTSIEPGVHMGWVVHRTQRAAYNHVKILHGMTYNGLNLRDMIMFHYYSWFLVFLTRSRSRIDLCLTKCPDHYDITNKYTQPLVLGQRFSKNT